MRKAVGVEGRRGAARRGRARSFKSRIALAAAASLAVASIYASEAHAKGIRGAKVTAGSASIRQKGPHTTIRAADRTIIRYDQFNVRKGESVRFVQPSKDARVLNRISGAAPSRIDGTLNANGMVYFVNLAGVLFGRGSVLNVGALYASAGDVRDEDFLSGVNRFQPGSGRIENRGTIVGGAVHLSGGEVVNSGTIVAERGVVTMTSGSDVFLADGEDSILVRVEPPAAGQRGTVRNAGEIRAGSVQMVGGSGVGDLYSIAVRNSGRIKAREITIDAKAGMARVGGTLDASSTTPGEKGGRVKVLGDKVAVTTAHVDASGPAGGGTVLVGGDFQGKGETPTASRTFIGRGATIAADATENGDGGRVIVWADEVTGFAGQISVRGGAAGGDGGFVEVSGKQTLAFRGTVDVSAPKGTMGTVLLDPRDITIVDADGGSDDSELNEILFDDREPPASADQTDFTISEESLEGINGTIILQAQRDVIVQDLATDGNLNLAAVNNGEALVIQAGRDITFIDTTNTITTAGGDVHLEAHSPHFAGHVTTGVGTLTLGNITTGGGDVVLIGKNFDLQGVINAGAGNIAVARSANADALRLGSATNPHLDDNEIDNLQTSGLLTLGRATTAGDDGDGAGGLTRTAATVLVDGATFGSRNVAIVSGGTINDEDDTGNAITTTGTLRLTSGGAIGGSGGAEGLNTNIDSLTVTSSGQNNITITNDGTQALELTSVATGGTGNIVVTQETNDVTIPDDGVVTVGSVAIRALAGSINASLGSENNGAEEIIGGGGVTLAGIGIGDAPQVEISGGGALVIESAGTAEVDVEVITTPFDSVTISQADRRADVRVSLPGTDLVEIHGTTTASTEGTTNDVLLFTVDTGAGVDFDYTLSDASGNVLVRSGNVFARGDFAVSSAGDIRLGDVAGVAIDADAGRDVTLTADGAIVNNGGSIAMDGGDLTLSAGTAIGAAATHIATTGSHGLRADAALGGVFITNGTSGTVTVNGTGVSGVGAAVELRNAVGPLVIAAGGVSTTGAGTITLEGQGVSQTGGTISADAGAIVIDGNGAAVTTGTITTNAAGNAVRVINTDTLAVNGPMSAANGTVALGEGGGGDRIGGSITQNASGVVTANVLTIDSAAGGIDLNGALNLIATLGAVSRNGRLRLTNDGALTIAAPLTGTTITNELSIQTDNGALTINADVFTSGANNISLAGEGITLAPGVTINAGMGTITLDGNDGAIDVGAGTLTTGNATSAAITLRDATTITLGATNAVAGGLVLGSGQDVTGSVTQAPGTAINVNAVSASTGGAITLDSAANAINVLGAITRGGALTVRDVGGGLTVNGPVTGGTTSNAVDIMTVGGVLAITGNVSTSGANNVSLAGVGVTLGDARTINGGAGQVLIDGGGGAIDLGTGLVITTNAGAAAITVRDATTVALGNMAAASGTLVIGVGQDVAGDVTQNAGMLVNAGTVTASTAGAITLANAGNTIGALGPVTRGGALTVRDAVGGLTIGGAIDTGNVASAVDVQTAGGALAINADVVGTDVTLTGAGLTQAAGSTVTAFNTALLDGNGGAIDLDGTVSGGTAITVQDGSVTSVGALSSPLGTVTLGVAGDITGPLTQSGPIVAAALNVSTNNTVTLENASNNVATLVAESNGTFAYADADGIAAIDVDSSGGDISLTALTGELAVGTLDAGAGDIVLTADDMNLAGGPNSIVATGDLALRPVSVARDVTIGVGAAGGLSLDDAELAALRDGFGLITIGRVADGTGIVAVTNATLTDDVSLVGGSIVLGLLNLGANDATLAARVAGIADSTGGGGANVIAQTVTLNAVTGIGGSGPAARIGLDTPVATATNTTSGGIFLDGVGAGGINFNAIDAQTSGNVELTSTGSATLTSVVTADGSVTADAVGLLDVVNATANGNANGNVNLHGGVVTIDTVTAANNAIVNSDGAIDAGTVTAANGDAALTAGTSITAGAVTSGNNAALSASTFVDADTVTALQHATLSAGTSITAGSVTATNGNAALTAGTSSITVDDVTAGQNATLTAAAESINAGTTAAGNDASLTAGTTLTVINVTADHDASLTAGSIFGGDVAAGHDATLSATALISADTVSAVRNATLTAGSISVGATGAGNNATLSAGGSIDAGTVTAGIDALLSAGTTIDAGGVEAGQDATLLAGASITAGTVDADRDATLTAAGPIDVGLVTAGRTASLTTTTNGDINGVPGDEGVADVVAPTINLAVQGLGTIGGSGAPLEVDADTLNASTTGGDIFLTDTANGVAVGLVSAGAGNVSLGALAGSITSLAVDGIPDVIGADIRLTTTGGGAIGAGGLAPLEINAVTIDAATTDGAIALRDTAGGLAVGSIDAGDADIDLNVVGGNLTSGAVDGAADVVGRHVRLTLTGGGSTIGIDETSGLEIAADTLEAVTNDGDIFVRQQDRDLVVRLVNAGLGNVTLIAEDAGSITSETVDGVADVIGARVTLRTLVDGSIGVDGSNPLEVNADTLTASATSAGGPSQIFVLDTLGGVAVANVAAGAVELTANNGGITSSTADGVADITADELTLRVSGAGSDIGASAGSPLEIDVDTLTGATGGAAGDDIFLLDTDGGVAIESLDADLGNVHLTAINGSITSAAPGAAADVVGSLVDLEIVGAGNIGAGAADPLRIDAAVLNADASAGGGGDIFITDVQGGVAVGLVTAGAGDVVLRAEDGSITSQAVDAAADIVGNRVEIAATGNARTLGASAGSRLELNATELHASTEDGAIFLSDTAGGVTVGTIDAGGQDVHLSATGGSIADDGNDATAISAGGLFLDVGAALGIGAVNGAGAIDTDVDSLTASAGTGGIFVQETSGITLSAVTAQGEIRVTALAGNIIVNTVTTAAAQQVRLAAPAGAITDGNGAATNVTGGHLRFTAQAQISLDTAASILTASSNTGNVNLREADGATLRSLTADGGDVTVTTATGDLEIQEIDADGTATLTATVGSIVDDGDDATEIVADEIVLSSGPTGSIGAAGTLPDIDTRGATIVASAGSGGAFITEADGAGVIANVTGTGPLRLRNGGGTPLVIAGASGTEDGDVSIDTDGVIRISAPLTSDGGDISLDADGVTDVRSVVRTGDGNITFGANRAGQVSLRADVSAPGNGTVTFNQAVSVDDDARVRAGRSILFGSAIDGDSALTLDGDADTDVTLSAAVGADTPLASLTIDGRNINLRDVTVDGNVAINSVPQVVGGLPAGLITLDGDVRSITRDVGINADGRADVPTVATIVAPGDVTVTAGGDVRMGRNEKFTAIGDLTIEAGNDAFLGDLTALNTLTIDAGGDITLLLRAAGGVRSPSGGIEQDDGLDLIGGDGIELEFRGRNIIFDGVGAAPRFASNNGIGLDRQNLAGLQTFALTTAVSAATLSDGAITLDGRVDGRIFAIVPVIAPKEARQAQLEAGVGAGMLTDLAEIGVNVRTLELDQLIEFLERLVVYDDVPPEMAAVPRDHIEPNRYRITRNRISFRAASQVVETYRRVFFTQPPAGADGPAKPVLRTREMGQRIDDAIADYRSKTPDAFDPLAFRRFVEETPAHAEALSYLNGIRELFVMIQPVNESEAGGGLGLTPAEAAISRQVILSKLEISGAEPQELEAAIFGVAPAPAEESK